jgi:hypothetical protein
MTSWRWIGRDLAYAVHEHQLAMHGGLDGIRDKNGVESASARPEQLDTYGNPKPDAADLAATYAYAYGLARNHGFSDGNKRAAWVIPVFFLQIMVSGSKCPQLKRSARWKRSRAVRSPSRNWQNGSDSGSSVNFCGPVQIFGPYLCISCQYLPIAVTCYQGNLLNTKTLFEQSRPPRPTDVPGCGHLNALR